MKSTDSQARFVPRGRRTLLLAAVVVASCCSLTSPAASAPPSGWQAPDDPRQNRSFYSETVLNSGKVLVAGGTLRGMTLARCDLYDPATGEWAETGRLLRPRAFHSATLLPDGRVLAVGGWHTSAAGAYSRTAELYDPETEQWSKAPKLKGGRQTHTATLLEDGTVLVVGGYDNPTYQRFDPQTDTWSKAKQPFRDTEAPSEHAAIRLLDGRVLVAGGWVRAARDYTNAAMLYDATADSWSRTGKMHNNRGFHGLRLLESGEVLVFPEPFEIWNPETGKWREVDAPPSE